MIRHPVYWFDDADIILSRESTLYRIHSSRIKTHKSLSELSQPIPDDVLNSLQTNNTDFNLNGCSYVALDGVHAVFTNDLVVLLDQLYGPPEKNLLSAEPDLTRVFSVLRATSPTQLDIPTLYEEAKKSFLDLFPKEPQQLAKFHCEHAEEAMALAIQNDILPCQKPLLYYLASQTDLDTFPSHVPPPIASNITQRAHKLSSKLIDRFTPLLFTPPPTSHMNCTDALAEQWMSLVISPAIDNSAMGKPLQTLEAMKSIDWGRYGLCEDCTKDKIDEWTEEQEQIWDLIDA